MKDYYDMPICYAIVDAETKEFYPDPVYADKSKAMDQIVYHAKYRQENGLEQRPEILEELTKERYEQHQKEWERYISMID
jgi:hypothetical protein